MWKWKILFWLMAIIETSSLFIVMFSDNFSMYSSAGFILPFLTLFPLYGFAYSFPIWNRKFAIAIFMINTVLYVAVNGFSFYSLGSDFDFTFMFLVLFAIFTLIYFIVLYPQYMYAFKSDNLWSDKNA